MREVSSDYPFFEYFEKHFKRHKMFRSRSPIDLHQEPRSRSSLDLRQPFRQPPIFLRDRPTSQYSSSRNRTLFPTSRRDLGPEFQGVKTHSQVSTPCYTVKQDSVANQEDDSTSQDSQKPLSPSGIDMRNPFQPETETNYQLLVLRKEFTPDMDALTKEFNSERNRVKREVYRANHTRE